MDKRNNQFIDGRREQEPVVRQRSRSMGLPRLIGFVMILAAVWMLGDRLHLGHLHHYVTDLISGKDDVTETPVISRQPPPPLPRGTPPPRITPVKPELPAVKPSLTQNEHVGELATMDISIGLGFRPIGFKIAAQSHPLLLSKKRPPGQQYLPPVNQSPSWYGVLSLSRERHYALLLEEAANGFQVYLDLNRNNKLGDDGAPLTNRGRGLFATELNLPLTEVTGIKRLQGDYRLWLFTNNSAWRKNSLRYYSMTQLHGRLLLKGKQFDAYLADNRQLDGDYRNDGIYIDINQDGKIERDEYIAPNTTAVVDGSPYRFRIMR